MKVMDCFMPGFFPCIHGWILSCIARKRKENCCLWSTWCGPCQMLAPVLEEVAAKQDDVKICKIDTDKELNLALQYKVASIPTLLLFKNGEVAATNIGFIGEEQVMEFIGQ